MEELINEKTLLITLSLLLSFNLSLYSNAITTSKDNNMDIPELSSIEYNYKWHLTDQVQSGNSNLGYDWIIGYWGHPATRDGEVDNITFSITYSHEISVSVGYDIMKLLNASLGYSIGESKSYGIERASAGLKAGEYVKASYRNNYMETTTNFVLKQFNATGDFIRNVDYKTVRTYEAILPQIKLTYHQGSSTTSMRLASNENNTLLKTEYYEADIAGTYHLTKTVINN